MDIIDLTDKSAKIYNDKVIEVAKARNKRALAILAKR